MKPPPSNPNVADLPRETQTYRCCGTLNKRWRFIGHHFHPNTIGKTCWKCGKLIPWENARYHNRVAANKNNGLTAHGSARVRVFFTGDQRAKKNRDKFNRLSKARVAKGLTTRGTSPVYRKRISDQERAWGELRAAMNIKAPEILQPLEREAA
jgi:hypothetical protein